MKNIKPFLFFYSLGVYIFYSIFQQILFKVICKRTYNSTFEECSFNETINTLVQSETSKWTLYMNIGCVLPALFVPILCSTIGPLVGSNRMLFLPLISDTLSIVIVGLYEFIDKFSNWILVLTLSLANIIGGYTVARALCNNYVSASVKSGEREKHFLRVEILCVLSYTLSGIIGGYVMYYLSIRMGIYICLSLILLSFIFLIFVQNVETKSKESSTNKLFSISSIKETFYDIPHYNRVYIGLYILSEFFTTFAEGGALDIIVLYCMRTNFQFSALAIGWVLSTIHAVKAIGSLIIYPIFIRKLKTPDWILSLINQFFIVGYFLILSFAKHRSHIIIGAIFFLFDGSISALISSSLSKSCDGKSRGMIFGLHSTITEIGGVLGCVFADYIYLETLTFFPGLTHLLLGVIMFIGCTFASVGLFLHNKTKYRLNKIVVFDGEKFTLLKNTPLNITP